MEHLYMDVLYTIKYKVGADTEMSAHKDQLYVYAQKAFDVTPEQHRRYMAIVHEEKVSVRSSITMVKSGVFKHFLFEGRIKYRILLAGLKCTNTYEYSHNSSCNRNLTVF